MRVRIEAPEQNVIARVLADLREVILSGSFVHTASKDDCRFCDYSAACDQSLEGRVEDKLGDSKLLAYGRLIAHV